MTWFDYYKPSETIKCPVCGVALIDWSGFDGPCIFGTIVQGQPGVKLPEFADDPVEDGGPIIDPSVANEAHPKVFEIESGSCKCEFPTRVRCFSEQGVWNKNEVITGSEEDRILKGAERKESYHRRMKWLDNAL